MHTTLAAAMAAAAAAYQDMHAPVFIQHGDVFVNRSPHDSGRRVIRDAAYVEQKGLSELRKKRRKSQKLARRAQRNS